MTPDELKTLRAAGPGWCGHSTFEELCGLAELAMTKVPVLDAEACRWHIIADERAAEIVRLNGLLAASQPSEREKALEAVKDAALEFCGQIGVGEIISNLQNRIDWTYYMPAPQKEKLRGLAQALAALAALPSAACPNGCWNGMLATPEGVPNEPCTWPGHKIPPPE